MNTTATTTTIVYIHDSIASPSSPPLPCMSDSYHVYGITCLLNALLFLLPRQVWPVQSLQHNVYMSWNISILAVHIYWFYQSGYRVLSESQIFGFIGFLFLALCYILVYFQLNFHWIVAMITVAILWTYEASTGIQVIGLAFVFLIAFLVGISCYNASWYCARLTAIQKGVIITEAIVIGSIAAFSLRFVIEQQPPSKWDGIGTTQVCCTNNANNAEQFSTDCPLSLTWVIITGCIAFTIIRLVIGEVVQHAWKSKEDEQRIQLVYQDYIRMLNGRSSSSLSLYKPTMKPINESEQEPDF